MKSQQDFYAGLMFFAFGAAFAWGASTYKLGTAAHMGPGFFPFLLGTLLALLGATIMVRAFLFAGGGGDRIGRLAVRPLLCILAANFAFGILLEGMPKLGIPGFGLIVSIYALVMVASMARKGFCWKESLVAASVLAAGSYLVFIVGLNLQFPVWPRFIAG